MFQGDTSFKGTQSSIFTEFRATLVLFGENLLVARLAHLLVNRFQVHALSLPESDFRHGPGEVVALGQLSGRVFAQNLRSKV
jgi:hypothetical protein